MAVVGGTAAVGLSRAGVRSALARVGLWRPRPRSEVDLDIADYLSSIGIDSVAVFGVAPRPSAVDEGTASADEFGPTSATDSSVLVGT